MSFTSWLQSLRSTLAPGWGQRHLGRQRPLRAATRRPGLDILEDRLTPSFSAPTMLPFDEFFAPGTVLSADFNQDARLDLAVQSNGGSRVYLGDGQGGFGVPSQVGAEGDFSLVAADFNNDGHLDLASFNDTFNSLNNTIERSVSVLFGNGDGTFAPPVKSSIGFREVHSLTAADFNGDGNMDLVYSVEDSMTEWGSVEVLLGDGQGGFAERHLYQLNRKNPDGLAVADLNADGRPDVVTTNYDYYDGFVSVLLGNGDGTLRYDVNSSNFPTAIYPAAVAVGDFTSDGIPDLVTTGFASGGSAVLPGRGDGTFAAPIHGLSMYAWDSLATADFNGDGRLDVLLVGEGSDYNGPVHLILGHGNGYFEEPEEVDIGGWYPSSPAAGDFNGDGRLDLAVGVAFGAWGTTSVSVLLNNGDWAPLPPSLRIGNVTVTEGNTGTAPATFTVTLSAASTETITVDYTTGSATATAGSDYQAASGTLTFAPGETSKTIMVLVNGDRLGEPNEIFGVLLSSPTNATIDDNQASATIVDDEPRISVSDVTKSEGKKGQTTLFTFTVSLSAAYDQPVTMSFRTVNGTTSDGDYVARIGTLTFAPGETTKTITVEVKGDGKREGHETFYLDLFDNSGNSLLVDGQGVGTILNDD